MHSKHEILISKNTGVSFLLIFMLVLLFFPVACGKKEVKPVTQESKTAQEAFELAEAIKKAYEEKDKSALEENTTADGYRELIGAIKSFDRAELALHSYLGRNQRFIGFPEYLVERRLDGQGNSHKRKRSRCLCAGGKSSQTFQNTAGKPFPPA